MWNVVFCAGAVYLFYLVFGGCLFMVLNFIKALGLGTVVEPDVAFDFTAMKTELLQRNFTEEAIDSTVSSWSDDFSDKTFDNSTIEFLNTWSYANSFFFAFHLCSTIGYGDLAPKTFEGQMLVIAFVTIGIPLNIIFFKVLGQSFAQNYEEVMCRISGSKDSPSRKMIGDIAFFIPWTLVLFVVPAVVFMFTEEWSFIEGLYSSFITLSTVGLGDYVAGVTRPMFVMFLIYFAYLVIGSICFVSLEAFEDIRNRNQTAHQIMTARGIANTLMEAGFSKDEINLAFLQEREIMKGTAMPKMVHWTQLYGEKIFFAFILITTIGYGNVSPSSQISRVVCIAYTLFGMPIHVIMMRLLSYEFRSILRRMLTFAQTSCRSSKVVLFVFGGFFFVLFLVLFICVPAYIFTLSDGWNYSLGVYFSFVSLTTIGLGDFVAGVSGEHLQERLYSLHVVVMLVWLVFGLAFVFMAVNTLSYLLGIAVLDKVDSKCRKRTSAKRRMSSLLDVIKDLNWNLVKFTPTKFKYADDIEQFKELLVENPQDVTYEKLLDMFRIMTELREQAYDDLSKLMSAGIPLTPIIQNARDNLPGFLSQESTTLTYSDLRKVETFSKLDVDGLASSDLAELQAAASAPELGTEPDREDQPMPLFRFGSAVDLVEIGRAVDREVGAEREGDAERGEKSSSANREDEGEEEDSDPILRNKKS